MRTWVVSTRTSACTSSRLPVFGSAVPRYPSAQRILSTSIGEFCAQCASDEQRRLEVVPKSTYESLQLPLEKPVGAVIQLGQFEHLF